MIKSYVGEQTHVQFLADTKTQDAVLRRFLVAGEAAARLTPETCAEFPNIPFHKIAGMRNRIVHDYGHPALVCCVLQAAPLARHPLPHAILLPLVRMHAALPVHVFEMRQHLKNREVMVDRA